MPEVPLGRLQLRLMLSRCRREQFLECQARPLWRVWWSREGTPSKSLTCGSGEADMSELTKMAVSFVCGTLGLTILGIMALVHHSKAGPAERGAATRSPISGSRIKAHPLHRSQGPADFDPPIGTLRTPRTG